MRLRLCAENMHRLTGRDDLELRDQGQEIDHRAIALLSAMGAAVRTPALFAGEGFGQVDLGDRTDTRVGYSSRGV